MKSKILSACLAVLACGTGALANAADVNVGINVGAPAPVRVAPVVVQPPVVIGWHGDRYWDGNRYWERREWEGRNAHAPGKRGFCPPGHAKKGEC